MSITDRQRYLQDLFRTLRLEAGLTQIELATRLNRHQSFVSKYEIGERKLDLLEIEDICEALGLELRKFVDKYKAAQVASS